MRFLEEFSKALNYGLDNKSFAVIWAILGFLFFKWLWDGGNMFYNNIKEKHKNYPVDLIKFKITIYI